MIFENLRRKVRRAFATEGVNYDMINRRERAILSTPNNIRELHTYDVQGPDGSYSEKWYGTEKVLVKGQWQLIPETQVWREEAPAVEWVHAKFLKWKKDE